MSKLEGQTVLITGASSGIGEACARLFAENGARVVLNARRIKRLEEIGGQLEEQFSTQVFLCPFDVRKFDEVRAGLESLPKPWRDVDILVNNAGLARGWDKFYEENVGDWEDVIDTNLKGLMYVTRLVLSGMVKRRKGHVVNIASISGIEAYANDAIYCASKAAVRALTDALKKDLLGTPVKVTAVSPGVVRTDFFRVRYRGDEGRASEVYRGYVPLEPRDVAEAVLFAVTRPAHVNLNEIVMMSIDQAGPTEMNIRSGHSRAER